ncbi:MAG TPA: Uma2 family endonuclease [Kouleothrix sp.]|nr:Uma2 family endonuclease [Kouleothrix sp.]
MTTATETTSMGLLLAGDRTPIDLSILQGLWTDAQYLRLTNQTNRLLEFTDGVIEVLPMPTDKHQTILEFLFLALREFMLPRGGKVLFAPLRLQIRLDKFREPDILLILTADDPRRQNSFWLGADLVVEIVSPDDPERDTVEKVADYAEAGIPEYWIVNPLEETITVLQLAGEQYAELGVFGRGAQAHSALLAGFEIAVDVVLDAR